MSYKSSRVAGRLGLATALGICAAVAAIGTAEADIISTTGLTIISSPSVTITGDYLFTNELPAQVIFAEHRASRWQRPWPSIPAAPSLRVL